MPGFLRVHTSIKQLSPMLPACYLLGFFSFFLCAEAVHTRCVIPHGMHDSVTLSAAAAYWESCCTLAWGREKRHTERMYGLHCIASLSSFSPPRWQLRPARANARTEAAPAEEVPTAEASRPDVEEATGAGRRALRSPARRRRRGSRRREWRRVGGAA